MRHATPGLWAAIFVIAVAAAPALGQTSGKKPAPPPAHDGFNTNRSVLSGDEIVLATLWQVDASCSSALPPTIVIRKKPKGGTVTLRETANAFLTPRAREVCGNKQVHAVEVLYKANEDFTGSDKPEIDLGYVNGRTRRIASSISVRKVAAGANEPIVESPEVIARRSTFAGNRIVLGNLHEYGRNCEPLPPPAARILKDASGGTLAFKESRTALLTKQARERCKEKTFEAIEVSYQSRPDFSGTETIDIEIAFQYGKTRKISYTIDVQNTPAGSREIKVEDQPREQNFKRDVFSGNEIRVAAPNNVQTDCTTGQIRDIRVVVAPEHGDLRFDTIKTPVSRPRGDSRNHCNGKEIEARAYFYRSKDGYAGDDKFTVDIDFKTGKVERYSYNLRVR